MKTRQTIRQTYRRSDGRTALFVKEKQQTSIVSSVHDIHLQPQKENTVLFVFIVTVAK